MSAATRRLILGAAALGALACGEIASPERTDLYEWRLFVPGVGGGTDTLSFFWSQSRLPVRIWAEDAAGLPGFAERAIGVWESGFLYREFRGEMVSDSSTADVLIFANSAPNLTLGVHRLHSMVKDNLGVPAKVRSCHTAQVGKYLVEGHVPAEDIRRMLKEKPAIAGLAAPGMAMEVRSSTIGKKTAYTVIDRRCAAR